MLRHHQNRINRISLGEINGVSAVGRISLRIPPHEIYNFRRNTLRY